MLAKRIVVILAVCLCSLLSTGISADAFTLNIRFETINGLVVGDRVLLDDAHIGHVRRIDYESTADFTVRLSIDRAFAEFLTEYSRFVVVVDPRDRDRMAVEVIQIRLGGKRFESDSTLKGSHRYQVLLEKIKYL